MDPYLEAHWLDIHTKLVAYAADALNSVLPEDLVARTEERVGIEADDPDLPTTVSPVAVLEAAGSVGPRGAAYGGRPLAQYRLVALSEPVTERFIEIRESGSEKLITVIEFVSPSNKTRKGLKAFINKREALLGDVNVVEIDMTRGGDWRGMLLPQRPSPDMGTQYRAVTRVATDPEAAYLEPISLRQALPVLAIPLRKSEAPIDLALQPLVEEAYRNGRYARTIDYAKPPLPPLDDADAAWADELFRAAGKR
jgi:hypothetical protein